MRARVVSLAYNSETGAAVVENGQQVRTLVTKNGQPESVPGLLLLRLTTDQGSLVLERP